MLSRRRFASLPRSARTSASLSSAPFSTSAFLIAGEQPEGEQDSERYGRDHAAHDQVAVQSLGTMDGEDAQQTGEKEGGHHLEGVQRVLGQRLAGVLDVVVAAGRGRELALTDV